MRTVLKKSLLLFVIFALFTGGVVYASDITNAQYMSKVTVVNGSASAQTGKVATFTLSTADMISAGMLNATATDCAIRTGSTDIPFMPSVNSTYPWCTFVDSIGASTTQFQYLYSSNVTGGLISWFPGTAGMTVADNASLEWGNSGNTSITGYFDPTSTGYLFSKASAVYALGNGDGTVTIGVSTGASTVVTPTGSTDAGGTWTNDGNAYDGNTGTIATEAIAAGTSWGNFLELALPAGSYDSVSVISGSISFSKLYRFRLLN